MRAAVYDGGAALELREMAHPAAEPGGFVITVEACGICATDLKIVQARDVKMEGNRVKDISFPRVIGHEVVGKIVEVGDHASAYRVGDRVTVAPSVPCGECIYCQRGHYEMCDNLFVIGYDVDGGFAEFMAVPAQAVAMGCAHVLPPGLPSKEATLTEPLSCVVNALELTPVEEGDIVVVIGAGPMGCLHVEMAKLKGAGKIILADRTIQRLQVASMCGAHAYVSVSDEDLRERVLAETCERGADVVFVTASSREAQEAALALVAKRGRVNLFAGLPRHQGPVHLDTNLIHYRECLLTGTHGSTPQQNSRALELLIGERARFAKYVTHAFPLDSINEAFTQVRRHVGLKAVILPCPAV